jgi:hypothetical protein
MVVISSSSNYYHFVYGDNGSFSRGNAKEILFNSPKRPGRVILCAACKSPTERSRVPAPCHGQPTRAAAGCHVREVSCATLAVR